MEELSATEQAILNAFGVTKEDLDSFDPGYTEAKRLADEERKHFQEVVLPERLKALGEELQVKFWHQK